MVKKLRRNQFARNFKAQRLSAGLNQIALAQVLGVTQVTVSLYESGRREPDLDDLMTIAEKLGTTPNDLLGFFPSPSSAIQPQGGNNTTSGSASPIIFASGSVTIATGKHAKRKAKDAPKVLSAGCRA